MGEDVSVMGLLEQRIVAIDLGTQNTLEEWDLQNGHFEQKKSTYLPAVLFWRWSLLPCELAALQRFLKGSLDQFKLFIYIIGQVRDSQALDIAHLMRDYYQCSGSLVYFCLSIHGKHALQRCVVCQLLVFLVTNFYLHSLLAMFPVHFAYLRISFHISAMYYYDWGLKRFYGLVLPPTSYVSG